MVAIVAIVGCGFTGTSAFFNWSNATRCASLSWAHGTVRADVALLTTWRCPDAQAFPAQPGGSAPRYIATHYDVANRLFSPDTGCRFEPDATGALRFVPGPNAGRVVLGSRSGRLTKMQGPKPMAVRRQHFMPERVEQLAHTGCLDRDAHPLNPRSAAHSL